MMTDMHDIWMTAVLRRNFAKRCKINQLRCKNTKKRLKKAMFAYSKGDAASGRGQAKAGEKLLHNAQHQFEQALEYLSERLAQDPGLRMWFDRELDSEKCGWHTAQSAKYAPSRNIA